MKKITALKIDNISLINEFSKRKTLSSHPLLLGKLNLIIKQYDIYEKSNGNLLKINHPEKIDKTLANALRSHYKNEIKGLEFISSIRNDLSPDVCPMCGGLGAAEVDHVAPKEQYPEYAFFSSNLVPACSCNNKKSEVFRDEKIQARILHPYFDKILHDRLAFLKYSGNIETPKIEIVPTLDYTNNINVCFHINNIIKKSTLKTWKLKSWSNIFRNPSSFLSSLEDIKGEISIEDIKNCISRRLGEFDRYYETPNNWFSMMLFGLNSNPYFLNGLAERVNVLRAGEPMV